MMVDALLELVAELLEVLFDFMKFPFHRKTKGAAAKGATKEDRRKE